MEQAGKATCCILVPGTWAGKASWAQPGSKLCRFLDAQLGGCSIHVHEWSYHLDEAHRRKAADSLTERIQSMREQYGRMVVIGHSHGGNVVLNSCRELRPGSVEAVTMNTPFLFPEALPKNKLHDRLHKIISAVLLLICACFLLINFRQIWIIPVSLMTILPITLFGIRGQAVTKPIADRLTKLNENAGKTFLYPRIPPRTRFLVLYDTKDEVSDAYTSLLSYFKRHFSYLGNLTLTVSYSNGKMALVDVKLLLAVLLPIIALTYVMTDAVHIIPKAIFPIVLVVSAPLLPVLGTILFCFFTFLVGVASLMLAVLSAFVIYPMALHGVRAIVDGFFLNARVRPVPSFAAGAPVTVCPVGNPGPDSSNVVTIRPTRKQYALIRDGILISVRETALLCFDVLRNLARNIIFSVQLIRHPRHSGIYEDDRALNILGKWLGNVHNE